MRLLKRNWICLILIAVASIRFLLPSHAVMSDEEIKKVMERGKSAEALAWAHEADGTDELRTIHELNNELSLQIIKDLYDLGAVKVTAAEIDSDPDFGETTNVLIVELPEDAAARRQLFQYESKHSGGLGFVGTADKGQKYLFFYWT